MGFRYRKRITLVPGIKLNLSKIGLSSLSFGGNGGTFNIGRKGNSSTIGIPGSGLSYRTYSSRKEGKKTNLIREVYNFMNDIGSCCLLIFLIIFTGSVFGFISINDPIVSILFSLSITTGIINWVLKFFVGILVK